MVDSDTTKLYVAFTSQGVGGGASGQLLVKNASDENIAYINIGESPMVYIPGGTKVFPNEEYLLVRTLLSG